MTIIGFLLIRRSQPRDGPKAEDRWRRGSIFVLGNALAGPTLGVRLLPVGLAHHGSGLVLFQNAARNWRIRQAA